MRRNSEYAFFGPEQIDNLSLEELKTLKQKLKTRLSELEETATGTPTELEIASHTNSSADPEHSKAAKLLQMVNKAITERTKTTTSPQLPP